MVDCGCLLLSETILAIFAAVSRPAEFFTERRIAILKGERDGSISSLSFFTSSFDSVGASSPSS
jgi:hypothetical protein